MKDLRAAVVKWTVEEGGYRIISRYGKTFYIKVKLSEYYQDLKESEILVLKTILAYHLAEQAEYNLEDKLSKKAVNLFLEVLKENWEQDIEFGGYVKAKDPGYMNTKYIQGCSHPDFERTFMEMFECSEEEKRTLEKLTKMKNA